MNERGAGAGGATCGEKTFFSGVIYQGETANARVPVGVVVKPKSRYIYEGEIRANPKGPQRHGSGVLNFPNGGRYEGIWVGDVEAKHGVGMTPGGGFYVGEWAANERNGYGLEITPDGDVYQGHFLGDARSGWGIAQRMEFGSEGDTIQLGLWEKGQLTLKRRLGGGVTKVLTQVTEDEVDKVHAAVRESHKEVATAFDMAQVARRAQLRASDAQLKAMAKLDEHADDGTDDQMRAFLSTSEADAVEYLRKARTDAESASYLSMAHASIQLGNVEHRIAMALKKPRNHQKWRDIVEVATKRVGELHGELRRLKQLVRKHRKALVQSGIVVPTAGGVEAEELARGDGEGGKEASKESKAQAAARRAAARRDAAKRATERRQARRRMSTASVASQQAAVRAGGSALQ